MNIIENNNTDDFFSYSPKHEIKKEGELLDTELYKLLEKHDAFPSANIDKLFRLVSGVVVGRINEGHYLVECGKNTLKCKSKQDWTVGDSVSVYTDDGVVGDIDKGEIHGKLHDSMKNGNPVRLTDIKHVQGGYTALYHGVSIFIPGSQIALNVCTDFSKFEGKDVDVIIMTKKEGYSSDFGEVRINYTASRKKLLKKIGDGSHFEEVANSPDKTVFSGTITGFTKGKKSAFVGFDDYHLNTIVSGFDIDTMRVGDQVDFYVDSLNYKKKRIYSKQVIRRNNERT